MSQPAELPRLIGMMKWLIRNRLAAFERKFGYDTSYARELLDIDLRAFLTFARAARLSRYRRDVPRDVYCAAGLTAIIAEDCGPCSQLGVAMALADGVDARTIATIAEGNEALMSEPVRLGARFARAVLAHDPSADTLREQIEQRWGKRALVSLTFTITASRVYPTIKYALGYGKACQRLVVAGETIIPRREPAVVRAVS